MSADLLLGLDLKKLTVEFLQTPLLEFLLAPMRDAVQDYFPGVAKDDLNFLIFLGHFPIAFLILSVLYFGVFARMQERPAASPKVSSSSDNEKEAAKAPATPPVEDIAAGVDLDEKATPVAKEAKDEAPATSEAKAVYVDATPTPVATTEPTPARRGRGKVNTAAEPADSASESSVSNADRPRRTRRETQHFSPSRMDDSSASVSTKSKPAARKRTVKS